MPSAMALHTTSSAARLLIALLTISSVLIPSVAHAQAPNARISGEIGKIDGIIHRAASTPCSESQCRLLDSPLRLTVSGPSGQTLNLRLLQARVPTEIVRESVFNDGATRPILLRGYARVRHAGPHGETLKLPIAATLYRDPGYPVLEIATPRIRRRSNQSGLLIVKAHRPTLTSAKALNARAQFASSSALSARHCGFDGHAPLAGASVLPSISQFGDVKALTTYHVIYIGTDYDAQFASSVGCGTVSACQNRIVSIIDQAAVFYEKQFGYTLQIARQFGPTSYGSDTSSDTLLDTVQAYNFDNRSQYAHTGLNTTPNQFDLFQFFTGRTLDNDVIGIAYQETACRNSQSQYNESLIQHTTSSLDPVVSAHEFGHNLGAGHVSSGIMTVSLGEPPPQSFASASVTAISNFLLSYYTECRQGVLEVVTTPIPSPSPSATHTPAPTPTPRAPTSLSLTIRAAGKKQVSITYGVSSISPECLVTVRAATSAAKAKSGSVIANLNPNSGIESILVASKKGATPAKNGDPYIYFSAQHSCADGSIIEISKVRKLNPNRIKGIRGRTSKSGWISLLKKAIEQLHA